VLTTPRLRIVPLSLANADAILHGIVPGSANWAPGYPTEGTLVGAGIVVTAAAEGVDLGPWTFYQAVRDGRVVGGVGFHARPVNGRVPLGYGATDEADAEDLMPEALGALVSLARSQGVVAFADAAEANARRIEILGRAGLRRAPARDGIVLFEG
jgi:hypothetical protein